MKTAPNRRRTRIAARPLETLEARRLLTGAGVLDTTFGQGTGVVSIPFHPASSASAVAVQSDGKIVIAGSTTSQGLAPNPIVLAITRLNPDGSLDTTFGTDGKQILDGDPGADAVAIEPDGKIVVVGREVESGTGTESVNITVLNPDGSLDTGFGQGGNFPFSYGSGTLATNLVGAIAVEPDGSILVGGLYFPESSTMGTFDPQLAVAKVTPGGTLDATFGNNAGVELLAIPVTNPLDANIAGIALQANGQIVVTGDIQTADTATSSSDTAFVARLDTNGLPDSKFGPTSNGSGLVLIPSSTTTYQVFGIGVEANGDIAIGGISDGQITSSRLLPDGSLDTAYGVGGTAVLSSLQSSVTQGLTGGMQVQADGKVVVSTTLAIPLSGSGFTGDEPVVGRFTTTGTADTLFGNSSTPGIAGITTASQPQMINALAITTTGNLISVGGVGVANPSNGSETFEAIQVTGRATPVSEQAPGDFEGTGTTPVSVYLAPIGSFAFRPPTGPDVIVPFGYAGVGQSIPAVGDYTGVGHAELGVYLPAYGVYAYRPANGGLDVTVPFGLPGAGQSIPTPADFDGTGLDDIAVYMPSLAAYGIRPSNGGPDRIVPIGIPGAGQSLPVPADYFGTGQADVAVYVASLGAFAIRPPGGGADVIVPFGLPGVGQTIPIPGDYDGSGHVELAVYLPSTGQFIYRPYAGGPDVAVSVAQPGQNIIPVPGDYLGDGHLQFADYDPTTADLVYFPGGSLASVSVPFGAAGPGQSLPSITPASAISTELPMPDPTVSTKAIATMTTGSVAKASVAVTVAASHPKANFAAPASPIGHRTTLSRVAQANSKSLLVG